MKKTSKKQLDKYKDKREKKEQGHRINYEQGLTNYHQDNNPKPLKKNQRKKRG